MLSAPPCAARNGGLGAGQVTTNQRCTRSAPSGQRNVAAQHTDVLARIADAVNAHKAAVVPGTPNPQ